MRSSRSVLPDDRTTKARIRDAAIACFARRGVANTSLRVIATEASVAPSHIIHYFGSKEGLRQACDEHIAALLRAIQGDVVGLGTNVDPIALLRTFENGEALLGYLARLFSEHDASANALVDQIVADSLVYIQGLADAGWITQGSRERDILLVMFSLGQIAMGPHATRWTGADFVHAGDDPASLSALVKGYVEFGTHPLLTTRGAELMTGMFDGDDPDPPVLDGAEPAPAPEPPPR